MFWCQQLSSLGRDLDSSLLSWAAFTATVASWLQDGCQGWWDSVFWCFCQAQGRKQTSQALSLAPQSFSLLWGVGGGGTGSCVFPRLECCVLIGLDQIYPGIPQTSSTSNTWELVGNAVCQPHPGSNSEAGIGTQKFSSVSSPGGYTARHIKSCFLLLTKTTPDGNETGFP